MTVRQAIILWIIAVGLLLANCVYQDMQQQGSPAVVGTVTITVTATTCTLQIVTPTLPWGQSEARR